MVGKCQIKLTLLRLRALVRPSLATLIFVVGGSAGAQPIFTTAPQHLHGIKIAPPAPRQEAAPQPRPMAEPQSPLPAPLQAPAQQAAPRMLAIPGFPVKPQEAQQVTPSPAPQYVAPQPVAPQPAPASPIIARPAEPGVSPLPGAQVLAPAGPSAVAGSSGPVKQAGQIIRHLTNNIQGFRLSGEIGSSEWPVYFTQAQTQQKLQFQLGYLTAVSVMPEASYLKLIINDIVVGRANIQPTQGVRTVIFDIQPGLVQPGFNSVRLTAEQTHRVDCSLNATYELWTQIDPGKTGFVLPAGDAGATGFADLAALPPDEQGALPIRIVLPGKTTPQHLERIIRSVQMISLVGRFEQPVVDIGPIATGQYGINLVIGASTSITDVLLAARTGPIDGPRAIIVPSTGGRRTTVIITGRTDEEIDLAFNQLTLANQTRGTTAGVRAARSFPGYRIDGGQRVRLSEMGIRSQEFSGRLFRTGFNLIMPPDFYAADYGKATLDLAGGYSAGLTNAAQIIVSVNGRNAVNQKMPKSGGDVFKQNPIPLQLGHLQPGLNRIEIEAQVPVAEDEACDPLAAINGRKRFLFLDSTEFELPRIARIARVPDLAITATGGFPFTGGSMRPNLYLPTPDRHAIAATATMAAHLAIAAGAPIDFRFMVTRPAPGSGPTLMMAPFMSLDADTMASVGLRRDDIHAQWQERLNEVPRGSGEDGLSEGEQIARNRLVLQRNFPAACHLPKPPGGFKAAFMFDRMPVGSVPKENAANQTDLFEEWDNRIRSQSRVMGHISGFVRAISDWFRGTYSSARVWIDKQLDISGAGSPITPESSLILAQNILGDSTDHVWTIVTAPNTGLLAQSVSCLVDPRVWRQIAGRIAVLNAGDGTVATIAATDSRLIPTQPLSVRNVRLIVAGWFSLNSKIYVLTALIIALLLAASTQVFLRHVGRRTE